MSAFVIGIPVPDGLDAKVYRVRVVVDRIDGAALTPEDLAKIDTIYPSKPAKRRTKPASTAPAPKAKATKKPGRAA
jgi:hypothetical protein